MIFCCPKKNSNRLVTCSCRKNVTILPSYIIGTFYVTADALSRSKHAQTEWSLSDWTFLALHHKVRFLSVNLMETPFKGLPSQLCEPKPTALSICHRLIVTILWGWKCVYIFLLAHLILKALRRLIEFDCHSVQIIFYSHGLLSCRVSFSKFFLC